MSNQASNNQIDDSVGSNQPERVDVVPSVDVFEQEFEAKLEPPLSAEQRAGQLLIEAKDILPRGRKGENKSGNKLVVLENLTSEEKTALIQKAADKNFIILEGTDGKVAICRQRNLEYAKEKNFSLVLPKKEDETPEKTVARANGAEFEQEREKKGTARRVIEGIPKAIQKNLALVNALNRQKNFLENYGIYEDPTRDVLGIRKFMGLYTKSNYKWGQQLQVTTEATEEGVVKLKVDKVINLDEDSETSSNYRKAILKKTGLGESSFEVIKNALFSKNVVRTLGEGIELGLTAAAMIGGGIQMSEFIEKGAKKGVEMVAQGSFTALARALNWGRLPVQNLIKGVNEVRLGERTMREFLATTVLSLPAVFLLLGPGTYLSEGTGIGAGTLARKMGFDVVKSRMTDRAVAWSVRRSLSTFAPVLMYNLAAKAGYFEAFGLNEQEQQTSFRKFREMVSSIRSLVLLAQFQMSIGLFDRFSMVSVRENIAGSWLGQNILGAQPAQNPVLEQLLPQAKGRPGLPTPGKGGKAGEFMGFDDIEKNPVARGEKSNLLEEKLENLKPFEKGPPRGPVPIVPPWGIPDGKVRSGVIEEHLMINNGIAPLEVVREGSHFGDINVFADGQNIPMEIVMDGDGHILGFIDQRSPSPQLIPLQAVGGGVIGPGFGPWRHEGLGVIPGGDQVFAANMDTDPGLEYIVFRNGPGANDVLQVQYIIDTTLPPGAPAPVAGSPIVGNLIYSADGTIPIYGAAGIPLPTGLPSGLVVAPPGGISTAGLPIVMPPTSAGALPPGFVGGPAVGAPAAPGAATPGVVSSGYGTTSPGVVSWITGAGSSFENERQTAVFIAQHVLADLNGGVRPEDYGLDSSAFAAMSPTDKEAIALDIARRIVQGQDPSGPTYADVNAGKYFTGGVGTSAIPDTTKLDTLINDFKNGVVTGTEGPMAINYYPGTTNVDPFWDGAVGKLNAATATPGVVGPGALPGVPAAGAAVITPGGGLIGAGGTPIMPAVEVTYTNALGVNITETIMPWDHHNDPAIIAALQASGYETNWQQVRYGDQILYWAENSDDGVNGAIIYGGNGVPLDPNNGLFMSRSFKDGELVMVNGMYFDNQGGNLVEITENEFLKRMRDVDLTKAAAVLGLSLIGLGALGALTTRTIFRTGRSGANNNPPNIPPQNPPPQQQPQQPPVNANQAGGGGLGNAAAPVVVPPQPISNIGNNTNTDSFNNEMNIQPGAFQVTNNVDLTPVAAAINGMTAVIQQLLVQQPGQPGAGTGATGAATAQGGAPVGQQQVPGAQGAVLTVPEIIQLIQGIAPFFGNNPNQPPVGTGQPVNPVPTAQATPANMVPNLGTTTGQQPPVNAANPQGVTPPQAIPVNPVNAQVGVPPTISSQSMREIRERINNLGSEKLIDFDNLVNLNIDPVDAEQIINGRNEAAGKLGVTYEGLGFLSVEDITDKLNLITKDDDEQMAYSKKLEVLRKLSPGRDDEEIKSMYELTEPQKIEVDSKENYEPFTFSTEDNNRGITTFRGQDGRPMIRLTRADGTIYSQLVNDGLPETREIIETFLLKEELKNGQATINENLQFNQNISDSVQANQGSTQESSVLPSVDKRMGSGYPSVGVRMLNLGPDAFAEFNKLVDQKISPKEAEEQIVGKVNAAKQLVMSYEDVDKLTEGEIRFRLDNFIKRDNEQEEDSAKIEILKKLYPASTESELRRRFDLTRPISISQPLSSDNSSTVEGPQPKLTDKLNPQGGNGNFEPPSDLFDEATFEPSNLKTEGASSEVSQTNFQSETSERIETGDGVQTNITPLNSSAEDQVVMEPTAIDPSQYMVEGVDKVPPKIPEKLTSPQQQRLYFEMRTKILSDDPTISPLTAETNALGRIEARNRILIAGGIEPATFDKLNQDQKDQLAKEMAGALSSPLRRVVQRLNPQIEDSNKIDAIVQRIEDNQNLQNSPALASLEEGQPSEPVAQASEPIDLTPFIVKELGDVDRPRIPEQLTGFGPEGTMDYLRERVRLATVERKVETLDLSDEYRIAREALAAVRNKSQFLQQNGSNYRNFGAMNDGEKQSFIEQIYNGNPGKYGDNVDEAYARIRQTLLM